MKIEQQIHSTLKHCGYYDDELEANVIEIAKNYAMERLERIIEIFMSLPDSNFTDLEIKRIIEKELKK